MLYCIKLPLSFSVALSLFFLLSLPLPPAFCHNAILSLSSPLPMVAELDCSIWASHRVWMQQADGRMLQELMALALYVY